MKKRERVIGMLLALSVTLAAVLPIGMEGTSVYADNIIEELPVMPEERGESDVTDVDGGQSKKAEEGTIVEETEEVQEQLGMDYSTVEDPVRQEDNTVSEEDQKMFGASAIDPRVQLEAASFLVPSTMEWLGSGTQADPYTPKKPTEQISLAAYERTELAARTLDKLATVNGHAYQYTQDLHVGMNDISLEVISQDKTLTVYYFWQVNRNKKRRPSTDIPSGLGVVSPSSDGADDGKIINLDPKDVYEYRIAGSITWNPLPVGTTEITGLRAGNYDVRYGESDEYLASGTSAKYYIFWSDKYTIEAGQNISVTYGNGSPSNTVPVIDFSPAEARLGEDVSIGIGFTVQGRMERRLIKTINYKFGTRAGSDWDDKNTVFSYKGLDCRYVVKMPSGKTTVTSMELYSDNPWYTVVAEDLGLKLEVTPEDAGKYKQLGVYGSQVNFYEHGSKVVIGGTMDSNLTDYLGNKKVTGFDVVNSKGSVVARSVDGKAVEVTSIEDDLRLCNVKWETIPANFTTLWGVLAQVPADSERNRYTDSSWNYLQQVLSGKDQILQLSNTRIDQMRVDTYATKLYIAIQELQFRPAPTPVYTVTLDSMGGTGIYPLAVAAGGTVPKPEDPVRVGYLFAGWYQDKEYTEAWDFTKDVVRENMTLYARWELLSDLTVTFDSRRGSVTMPVTGLSWGSRVPEPEEPEREFYIFTGWYQDEECRIPWDFLNDTVSGNLVLYAGWKPYTPETPVITKGISSTTAVKISWKKIPKVTGYVVYGYTGKAFAKGLGSYDSRIIVRGASKTSCLEENLRPGIQRTYIVKAYKHLEGKNYYGKASKQRDLAVKPKAAAVKSITPMKGAAYVELKTKAEGAQGYAYCTSTDGKKYRIVAIGPKEPYKMKELKKGINYIKVRSYTKDIQGRMVYGNWSKVYKAKVL